MNKSVKLQNILLLVASYFFYACWDYRFLFLLIFSTLLDYTTAIKMCDAKNLAVKKCWFWLSIVINLGFLGFFKYYNFFITSFAEALAHANIKTSFWTLQIILPVGISFYTFHGLSYIIDIYNDKIKPEKNFVDYSLFVSFFPLLVAGPIERATHLLPQLKQKRTFSNTNGVDGLRQILWGLFKKVVIADSCADYVNTIFHNPATQSGSTLLLGAFLFTCQIYCDFSGYSDIALGTARLLGIDLLQNFAFPYFSQSIAEFWRRWHISLSSWFRDYLYIPLNGSKGNSLQKVRNVLVIFIVSGFWHGANWTFIIWGLLNALYIMPSVLLKTNRNNMGTVAAGRLFPSWKELLAMITTFSLTVFAWIFFRAETLGKAITYIRGLFSRSLFTLPDIRPKWLASLLLIFFLIEWVGREQQYAIAHIGLKWSKALRWGFYYLIVFMVIYFSGSKHQFIYFQF